MGIKMEKPNSPIELFSFMVPQGTKTKRDAETEASASQIIMRWWLRGF